MGRIEFQKLPITTLIGASWGTFRELTRVYKADKGYKKKYYLTMVICRILSILKPIEDRKYKKLLAMQPIENDPLFILGHWRSGTTYVHNVLCKDKNWGYTTTYQTVFPNIILWGQRFFKSCMGSIMPDKRPTDNMELNPDLPQEEEFAMSNLIPYSFYDFWFFPKHTREFSDKYLLFNKATPKEIETFKEAFLRLVKISLWNTKGKRFLSKNPPHTGHVKVLLELFPNAKFVYLVRNPYTVFESTRSFFTNTITPLKLQDISPEQIEADIIQTYTDLYKKYEEDKKLIPAGNLIEIKFEDFEADALAMTKRIYQELSLPGYSEAEGAFKSYIGNRSGYKKNSYKYEDRTKQIVEQNWKFALQDWNYTI